MSRVGASAVALALLLTLVASGAAGEEESAEGAAAPDTPLGFPYPSFSLQESLHRTVEYRQDPFGTELPYRPQSSLAKAKLLLPVLEKRTQRIAELLTASLSHYLATTILLEELRQIVMIWAVNQDRSPAGQQKYEATSILAGGVESLADSARSFDRAPPASPRPAAPALPSD